MIEYYIDIAQKKFATNPWLLQIQKQALKDLKSLNFPNKHDEDWKYSSLDMFLKKEFCISKTEIDKHDFELAMLGRHNDAPLGIKIPIINGNIIGLEEIRTKFVDGVIVDTISSALNKYPSLVKKHLNQILNIEHGMHALNSAMLDRGLLIYIPNDVKFLEPILLKHFNTEANSATFLRHVIIVEQGSSVKIIEDYHGVENISYFSNVVTEVYAGEKSQIEHIKVQRESESSIHFSHVFVKQLANSEFKSHVLNVGGCWSRTDISIDLIAQHAACWLNGVYMPIHAQNIENKTYINHAIDNCFSEQDYRGIAADKAQAVFNGKIYVAKDAIATVAKQKNKNLLLSNFAKIYTKPQLEIFADDVSCSHGATVGQLDEDALFYLATRGIDASEARRYLLHAFVDENINKVDNKEISKWMSSLLEQQMG